MSDVPSNLIPTRITQLPSAPLPASADSLMQIVYQGNNYHVRVGDILTTLGPVPSSRNIIAGTGMAGGGTLTSDVTLGIAVGGVGYSELASTGVTGGVYGTETTIPVFVVDIKGRITSATSVPIVVAGYVPNSRTVTAGTGLTGGGALGADITLTADLTSSTPLRGQDLGVVGISSSIARADHRHPSVDISDESQIDSVLALGHGGTSKSIIPVPGGVVWCGSDGLYVGPVGIDGQVLVSKGTGEYAWGSALLVIDQPANVVYAGPSSGPDAPTNFRSLVNDDLPASGVSANTYGSGTAIPVVTVNAKGVVTNVTTSAVTTPNAVTFTSTGGAAPGATFDGSAAKTIDYSTVGAAPAGAYLTAVAVTAPVAGDGKAGTPINMAAATASVDGYLTKGDWTTFNTKQPAGAYLTGVTADAPLSGAGTSGSHLVHSTADGYLHVPATNTSHNGQVLTAGATAGSINWATPTVTLTGDVTTVGSAASLVKWGAGNVIYVPLAGDIQTYITAATAGDTLILASGTYVVTSTITVGKSLTIKGQGSAATKVNSSTAAIAVFTIAASNVRLLDISSTNSGAGTAYTIFVNAGLTNLQIRNVIGILSGTGTKYGVWSLSSVTVSDSEFYPTSSDSNSNGVYLYNDSSATLNITANIQSVRVIATGVANNNRGIVGNNNNTAYTITINSVNNWLFCYGTTGTTDIALYSYSTATNNVTINDYQSILNGADYDVLNTSTNVLALNGSILSNGTISGTITRKYDMQASSSTVNGYLTSTDWSTFNGKVSGPATNTADYIPQWNGANSKTLKDGLAVPAGGLAGITALNTKQQILTVVPVKTINYSANSFEFVPVDISAGNVIVTLPSAPTDGTIIQTKVVTVGLNRALEVLASGTDKFNKVGGETSLYMNKQNEANIFTYQASTGIWYNIVSAGVDNFATNFPGIDAATPITNANISINTTTFVLTITPPLGYFNIFIDGPAVIRYRKTGTINFPAFTNTSGIWYFYFDINGTAVTTQTALDIDEYVSNVPVYRLVWNATLVGAAKLVAQYIEYHVNSIPAATHRWFHLQGTQWKSGLEIKSNALVTADPNADGRNTVVALTSGSNIDDNLEYTVTNSVAGTPWNQDMGDIVPATLNATNSGLFKVFVQDAGGLTSFLPATRFPFAWNSGSNRPEVVSGTGVRTVVTDNRWFVYFVYSSPNPVSGDAVNVVSATTEFTSIVNARAFNWVDIQNTYPTAFGSDFELRPLYRVIFYNDNSGGGSFPAGCKYSVIREIQDIRKAAVTSTTAATGSLPASSVTFVPAGGIGATNVQAALEELDLEKANLISPSFTTPVLGTPTSGNFSTGTFTWPTFNQNTLGTAAGLSATLAIGSGGTGTTHGVDGGTF